MGNYNPWKNSASLTAADLVVTPVPERAPEQAPARFAELGLTDCGFEYRQIAEKGEDEPQLPETRLFHTATGVMITLDNRKAFVPDGEKFATIVKCCQQVVQEKLKHEYELEWIHLFDHGGTSIQALASPKFGDGGNSSQENEPILMIFTGKGNSRAGILSVRELLVAGLERGSALYHVHRATQLGWSVVLLDPNASGPNNGHILIRKSLDHLEEDEHFSFADHPIYILSHSAAGGYLVRHLLDGDHRQELLKSIHGLVFTDSTHNLQWAKDDPSVASFLESQRVLYIRNCSENPSDTFANHKYKQAGEKHEGNRWWYRRFGQIPTVWAGTTDHSAMCWVARNVIWDFFDRRSQEA